MSMAVSISLLSDVVFYTVKMLHPTVNSQKSDQNSQFLGVLG